MFHPFLGSNSLIASNHLDKSVAFVNVDYAGLHPSELRENRPQLILASPTQCQYFDHHHRSTLSTYVTPPTNKVLLKTAHLVSFDYGTYEAEGCTLNAAFGQVGIIVHPLRTWSRQRLITTRTRASTEAIWTPLAIPITTSATAIIASMATSTIIVSSVIVSASSVFSIDRTIATTAVRRVITPTIISR